MRKSSSQCHAEGGATKGGVSKCEQTHTNADKRRQTLANTSRRRGENASKRKQTRANVDKRKQTLTPPFIAVFYTPLCNPLIKKRCGKICPQLILWIASSGHLNSGWPRTTLGIATRHFPYRPPNPRKFKDTKKLRKSYFRAPGQSDSKVT